MPAQSFKNIKESIKKKRLTWDAVEGPLWKLPVDEQMSRLGLRVEEEELEATRALIEAETEMLAFREVAAAPAAVDWRNKGGDWTTSIKDQKSCGSCVAFGVAAAIEARINIACKKPAMDKDLSEADLFYCGCGNCCGNGWNFPPALDYCKNTGIGLESSFPYTPGNQPCKQGVTPYVKLQGWNPVLSVADRKDVIATRGPVVGGMAVYGDFYAYSSGIYRHASGPLRGYHAICVVGYDDNDECWICKNSWGSNWGDSGWFKIGYGECDIDTRFAFYDVELKCPVPDPCEKYKQYLIRVLMAARVNPNLKACLQHYVCRRWWPRPWPPRPIIRPRCTRSALMVVRRVRYILMRCPKFCRPFCILLSRL